MYSFNGNDHGDYNSRATLRQNAALICTTCWATRSWNNTKTTRGPFPGLGSGPLDLCCYIAFCCAVKAASGGGRLLPPGTYYNKESHNNDLTFQNELVGPVL